MTGRFLGSGLLLLTCAGLAGAQVGTTAVPAPELRSQTPPVANNAQAGSMPPMATSQPSPSGDGSIPILGNLAAPSFSTVDGAWSRPLSGWAQTCWIAPDFLLWRVKRGPLPVPLLEANPDDPGHTNIVFGNTTLDYGARPGGGLSAGAWFDDRAIFGVEASGFVLARGTTNNNFSSGPQGSPFLAIPFFNSTTQLEDFLPLSNPGAFTGSFHVSSSLQLWGSEGNLLFNLYRGPQVSFGLLAGLRYLDLRENLTINSSYAALLGSQVAFGGGFFDPPDNVTTNDSFSTHNSFLGGQLGFHTEWRFSNWFASLTGKIAMGGTHEVLDISGSTALNVGPVLSQALPGGIFALSSNIGRTDKNAFAVVPEVDVKLGYEITKSVSVFAGYNFMYWSSVARPGNQIDPALNTGLIPSANDYNTISGAGPQAVIHTTNFWAQGLNVGIEIRY